MIAGAMSAVEKTPYSLNLAIMKDERSGFNVEKAMRGMDVAGAIVSSILGVFNVSTVNLLDLSIPVLVLNQHKSGTNPGCFMIDNFKSAYDATMYLAGRGHRRIGFVKGTDTVKDAHDRYMGYRKAINDIGIKYDPRLEYQSNFLEESGIKAVRYYFSGKFERPSAIFFSSDAVAMTAINELRNIGVSCPKEVSIVGFDGIDAGRYTDPPLTTVLQPIYEMAAEAVRQIIRDIENGTRFTGSRFFIATVIERGSVASFHDSRKESAYVHG
jgi:DNA-binding LacI/PurR family transcriptional regulator